MGGLDPIGLKSGRVVTQDPGGNRRLWYTVRLYPVGRKSWRQGLWRNEVGLNSSLDEIRVSSVAVCRLDAKLVPEAHERCLGYVHTTTLAAANQRSASPSPFNRCCVTLICLQSSSCRLRAFLKKLLTYLLAYFEQYVLVHSESKKSLLGLSVFFSFLHKQLRIFNRFLPARRYASAGYRDRNVSVRLSVRPSVRHAPVLCQNEES